MTEKKVEYRRGVRGGRCGGGCMRCRCGCCEGSHVVRAYNGGCAAGTLREDRVGRCKLQDTGMGFLC
ncbi:hypothetical protein NXV13_28790 [Bacteroides ovatus]|nr:hypothetical protein [Bacteroides ovatus]